MSEPTISTLFAKSFPLNYAYDGARLTWLGYVPRGLRCGHSWKPRWQDFGPCFYLRCVRCDAFLDRIDKNDRAHS